MTTPLPFFKHYTGIAALWLLLMCSSQYVQAEGLCDSLTVSEVTIDGGNLLITVYNSSGQTIIYPYFTTTLDDNPYLIMEDTFLVLSLLSVPGDFNNGYTTAFYAGTYAAPETVPMHTEFTGSLIIGDPNDSTFSCTLPFTFFYGTMPTGVLESPVQTFNIYPNPSTGSSILSVIQPNTLVQVFDMQGKLMQSGLAQDTQIDLHIQNSGCYIVRLTAGDQVTTTQWIVR